MATNPAVKIHTAVYIVKVPDKNIGSFWLETIDIYRKLT